MSRWAKVAIGLAVAAGISAAVWTWRDAIQDAARQAVIGEELRQELRESEQELQRERERREQISDVAEKRLERLEALRESRDELEQAISDDDETAQWADRELPERVRGILHRDAGPGDGHED